MFLFCLQRRPALANSSDKTRQLAATRCVGGTGLENGRHASLRGGFLFHAVTLTVSLNSPLCSCVSITLALLIVNADQDRCRVSEPPEFSAQLRSEVEIPGIEYLNVLWERVQEAALIARLFSSDSGGALAH